MANYHPSQNSTSKTSNQYIYYRVKIDVTSTNASNRTATLKATLQLKRTDSSTYHYSSKGGYAGGYTSTIGGTSNSLGSNWEFNIGSSWVDIISSSHTYNVATNGNVSYSGSAKSFNGTIAPKSGTLNYSYSGTIASGLGAAVSAPSAPASISVSPQYFYRGQAITWSWPAVNNAEYYNVSYQYANPSNSGSGYDSWSAWSGNTRINTNQFTESWNNSIYKAGMRCQYAVQAVNSAGGSTWTYPTAYGYLCGRIDIKTSTGWKHGIGWINVGGTWKRAKCVWMNVGGTWKRGY